MSSNPKIIALLNDAFLEGLDLPPETVVTELSFGQHPHWDSLGHMTLVLTIEKMFDVNLRGDDIMQLDSFTAAIEILTARVLKHE